MKKILVKNGGYPNTILNIFTSVLTFDFFLQKCTKSGLVSFKKYIVIRNECNKCYIFYQFGLLTKCNLYLCSGSVRIGHEARFYWCNTRVLPWHVRDDQLHRGKVLFSKKNLKVNFLFIGRQLWGRHYIRIIRGQASTSKRKFYICKISLSCIFHRSKILENYIQYSPMSMICRSCF